MILWTSDTHLNFITDSLVKDFIERLNKEQSDGIIITGDISDAIHIRRDLTYFSENFNGPIYFVLGNHDYYHSSFDELDNLILDISSKNNNLHWLDKSNPINLDDSSVLVGVSGWYDGIYGNSNSQIALNDWNLIEDLAPAMYNRDLLINLIRERTAMYANELSNKLSDVCSRDCKRIIIATHVAPYDKAAWHEGSISGKDWLPWFSSKTIGDVIDRFADKYNDKKFIVLCGHSHSPGIYTRSDNLDIYTGISKYLHPRISGRINLIDEFISCFDSGKKHTTRKI